MHHNPEGLTGAKWSVAGDSRITPLGRVLRKSHIDELPQLLNVLRGEMNLVGPRPERPEIVPFLEREIPNYKSRFSVRPGLTGLAQLRLPADTTIESVRRKLAYDQYYIQNRSLWLDTRILLCTALKPFGVPLTGPMRMLGIPDETDVGESGPGVQMGAVEATPTMIRVGLVPYVRAIISLVWSAFRHPSKTTEIDLATGTIISHY